ncbi:tape measure protein [Paenibacillus naphthalenovorans]|uniref:tape measure protein n=1 Tax=Paenibacillus naphthalenovorans TaxID=162209 RepID=UPI003D272CAC
MAYDLVARLLVKDAGFSRAMQRAAGEAKRLQQATDGAGKSADRMSKAAGNAGSAFSRMGAAAGSSIDTIRRSAVSAATSIGGITTAIAGAAASFAAYKGTSHALKLASDAEQAGIAFETMLGSAEKAQKFIADLTDFATDTPFDLPGLRQSSQKLLAFGFAAERIIPMLTTIGDASSALGLGTDGINRITIAIGQIQAKSKVQGDEILQLTESGIPALEILAESAGVTEATMSDMISDGIVPADKAIKALLHGMDKRFGGLMDKNAKSLQGLYNTMKETFENKLLVRWGQGIASALKPRFEQIVKWITDNDKTVERWGRNIANAAKTGADGILRNFEGAYKYVRRNYIDNPMFQNLSASGKVSFVISDVLTMFNEWLKSDGGTQITTAAKSIVETLSISLFDSAGPLAGVAYNLGTRLAEGVIVGFQRAIADHPFLSVMTGALVGAKAGAAFGPMGVAVGAGVGLAGGVVANQMASNAVERKDAAAALSNPNGIYNRVTNPQMSAPVYGPPAPLPTSGPITVDFAGATRRYNGLDRVPYDGYRAILHKDERIQTKAEASEYRSGRRSGDVNVSVTMNGVTIRNDSDIDSIARALAKELEALAQ